MKEEMVYYRTSKYTTRIDTVQFDKLTPAYGIKSNGDRVKLRGAFEDHYPTREEAVRAVWERLQKSVDYAQHELARAINALERFQGGESQ